MSEKKLYKDFKNNWNGYIKRLETKNEDGLPDLHLLNSWKRDVFVELKYLPKKFKSCTLPIKMTQFKWHSEYKGECGYMLFQIENEYFLFRSQDVLNLKGKINWQNFKNNVCYNLDEDGMENLNVITAVLFNRN